MEKREELFYEPPGPLSEKEAVRILHMLHEKSEPGCGLHWHERVEIYYVISGGVRLYSGSGESWLYPGDVAVVPGFLPHQGRDFLPKSEHYVLQVAPEFLQGEEAGLQRLFTQGGSLPLLIRQDGALMAILDHLLQEQQEKAPGWRTAIRGDMLRAFSHIYRVWPRRPQAEGKKSAFATVQAVLFYIAGHFTEKESVTLQALSRHFGLSVPYLCRLFRAYTGLTVNGYIQEVRLARGAALLRDGAAVSEAARAAGIEDPNYFARLFRQHTGYSPGEWKRAVETGLPGPLDPEPCVGIP